MAHTLVLMRHGRAQSAVPELPDDLRALTPEGLEALESWLPGPLAFIDQQTDSTSLEVWTSPAQRCIQTSKPVVCALGLDHVDIHRSLQDATTNALMHEVRSSSKDCIIAVGHNPFLQNLVQELCGVCLTLRPGAMVLINLDDTNAGQDAELVWFMQGPRVPRPHMIVHLEEVLQQAMARIETERQRFLQNPEDVEALHDFRVSIRTMRSLLAFCRPYLEPSQNLWMQHALRDIVRRTSLLRELDVFDETVCQLQNPAPDLLEVIEQTRLEECNRLLAFLYKKKTEAIFTQLDQNMSDLQWKKLFLRDGISAEALRSRFTETLDNLYQTLQTIDYADIDATHDLRKDAKLVRYTSEAFADIFEEETVVRAKAAVKMQSSLGKACDARVNEQLIDIFLDLGLSGDALENLAQIMADCRQVVQDICGIPACPSQNPVPADSGGAAGKGSDPYAFA